MQRLIFEYSPAFILLCVALGVGYAWLLYKTKHTWGKGVNQILFVVRTVAVALISFLLIGPILKLTNNQFEKPSVVFLVDNSVSLNEALDSVKLNKVLSDVNEQASILSGGDYNVAVRGLDGGTDIRFNQGSSDIHTALKSINADYEGKNLAGIVLVSDGIYNSGPSPLYTTLRVPVYTVGAGDTAQRVDLSIRNVAFNKIAYQGNLFPLRAEILVKGLTNQDLNVRISQGGKLLSTQSRNSGNKTLVDFDFNIDAGEKGIQRIDVVVEPLRQEANQKNNRAAIFVEVVEGKKRILLIAPAPHPDIKAIRATLEKNSNYEFNLHIPGVKETDLANLQPEKTDLVIFSQVLDPEGKTLSLLQKFLKSNSGVLLMLGSKSNLKQFPSTGIPLTFDNATQKDEVLPTFNTTFQDFTFSEGLPGTFARYPPVSVPFGKFTYPGDASVLLYQKIGSVITNRPLLFSWNDNGRKMAAILGEGIWKWRLNEYAENEKIEAFDEVLSKLVQYLSTQEDKRKFRSFPIQNEFTDSEPVIFESQLYNDLFEQIYGNTVEIELRDESGTTKKYSYITSPSGSRYRIGGLKQGIYRYKASTTLPSGAEQVSGEFLVREQNIESQNLTADFGLLKKIAAATGGKFYEAAQIGGLSQDLQRLEAKSLIHSEESFHPMINLKAVFYLLLFLLSLEWFTRKYFGSY